MTTILSEKPLSLYDAKKELKAIKKRDTELSFRSQRCDDYVNQFAKLSEKDAQSLKAELISLEIPRLREEHICKLIDIMPINADDIKNILSGYNVTVKAENIKKIDEAFSKVR